LVNFTGMKGLANIEHFVKKDGGKMWCEHFLFPKVKILKNLLKEFYVELTHYFFEYELLK
jgi:hypothetical protein